jgi:hypothetical protein
MVYEYDLTWRVDRESSGCLKKSKAYSVGREFEGWDSVAGKLVNGDS